MKYDFTYKDREGDEYSSDEFDSKTEAQAEVKRLKMDDDGIYVTETWIYNDDGEFKGRW
jgi:hypothetical protein